MRSLWLTDSCKDSQVHALNPIERTPQSWLQVERGKLAKMSCSDPSSFYNSSLIKLAEPPIEPNFKPLDYVEVLAQIHEELEASPNHGKSDLYLLQSQVFRGLGEVKLLRRSLQSAWKHASTVHEKLVYAAWLKHEKQGEEMISDLLSQCSKCLQEFTPLDIISEFSPKVASIDFSCSPISKNQEALLQCGSASDPSSDIVVFHIGEDEIVCNRQKVATMSAPFHAMLNGCFTEARKRDIDFSDNGISARGMRAICKFSETGKLSDDLSPDVLLDILAFANKFCCEQLKDACDRNLASLIHTEQDAITFMEYGLEEGSQVLVASCLQVILRELPYSLQHEQVAKLFYNTDMRKRSIMAGSASFALYSLLSDVAMKDDLKSDKSAFFLECLRECATTSRQKSLAVHQLGCVMLARREYDKAERLFDAAVNEGHVYSHAGLARAKYKRGYKHAAYDEISTLLSSCKQLGWMYQERSLYCDGKEKWLDLERATALDPTLTYPFMYRAAVLMREQSAHAALIEINRVLSFKLTLDCLELRTCFYLALQDYRGALSDIQAILTLNPNYMMYGGRVGASQLRSLLIPHVEHWTTADCWMQLYDRWSSVDDIGSLAVIYQMLESDSGKSLLFFRQSLLLLRLNCPEAAMHSLQLARQHATCEHERLVYEGWILYDTGHCEEGLRKAEESIAIQRSFEAFFLKAYALADSSIDPASSVVIVSLLAEALKCPSDGLRKGQALNNLGSVYVDCGKLDLAADCYVNALKIRHTRAHQGLARVYYLKNDKTAAYEEMTKLIEKARNKASAYEKRSEYCDREMTMADLQMVTELDPLRVYPYRYRAAVLMDSHQEEEAIAELSRAIAFKADLHLLHLRAAFHECIGDVAGALRDCRAALSVDPNHQEIMELHSRVHSQEP